MPHTAQQGSSASALRQPLVWWRTMYILSSSTGSTLSSCLQVSQFCVPQYSRQVLLLWGRVLAAPRQLGRAYRAQQLRAAVKTCMYVAADDFSRKYKNDRYIDIYFHFQKDYITNCFTLYVILRCLELSLFICLFNIRNQTIPPSMPGSLLCQLLVWWRTMYILSNGTDSKLSSCLQVSQFCASVQ